MPNARASPKLLTKVWFVPQCSVLVRPVDRRAHTPFVVGMSSPPLASDPSKSIAQVLEVTDTTESEVTQVCISDLSFNTRISCRGRSFSFARS